MKLLTWKNNKIEKILRENRKFPKVSHLTIPFINID